MCTTLVYNYIFILDNIEICFYLFGTLHRRNESLELSQKNILLLIRKFMGTLRTSYGVQGYDEEIFSSFQDDVFKRFYEIYFV